LLACNCRIDCLFSKKNQIYYELSPDAIEATGVVLVNAGEAIGVMNTEVSGGEQVISSCDDDGTSLVAAAVMVAMATDVLFSCLVR
jgi:hypothetical protein